MAVVGRDIRQHHLQFPSYTTETNGGSHRPSQQINVILAAPCYAFGGYAGLHLPLGSFLNDSIVIHSSPCVLRYVPAVISDAQGIYPRDREPTRVYVWCRMEPEMYFDFSPQQHTKELLASADATNATFVVDYVLTFDAYLQALNSTLGRSFSQVGTCTRYLRLLLTVLISNSSTAD
jgi:hypothetical protein